MEPQIKKILIPYDFTLQSKGPTLQGVEIAKLLKAEVYILHVITNSSFSISDSETSPLLINNYEEAIAEKMKAIKNEILNKYEINVETFIAFGNIVNEILEFSKKHYIDQIIMGTHGASGYKEMFIGSNAQRIVTLSKVPVLTILNNTHDSEFKNILLPINSNIYSREKVNVAVEIAKLYNSKIHIVGLINSDKISDLNKMKIKLESLEKYISHEHLYFVTKIEYGDSIAKTALDYANKNDCNLIVINTGHESKITGIFLGAFAQQIVNHSNVPVLSVRHAEGKYNVSTS